MQDLKLDENLILRYIKDSLLEFKELSKTNSIKTNIDKSITAGIHLNVYYGVNIPEFCYNLQFKLKQVLESKAGIPVDAINLYVDGIDRK